MDDGGSRGWRAAMADALYGAGGFYVGESVPRRHFRTSAHLAHTWAGAILELARRVDASLGSPASFAIVDVGAGGGELLGALADLVPERWTLHGVDVAPRPTSLPLRVTWSSVPPAGTVGLLVANELLDVVPVDVAVLASDGPRLVAVTVGGEEKLGDLVSGRDAHWLARWWPLATLGDRAEIGWPRDDLWRSLCDRLDQGLAVAIDYAVVPARDVGGTLAAHRDGRPARPVPDGSCDLTAHVYFASLSDPADLLLSQREALKALGLAAMVPTYDGDAAAYLSDLAAAGEAAELTDPAGLGGFTWLLHAAQP